MCSSCWTTTSLQTAVVLLLLFYLAGEVGSANVMTTAATTPLTPAGSTQCLKHCICKWKGGKESVTCHQAGLTAVPATGLDTSVQVLDLSGNPLTQLVHRQFIKLGLFHLQRIILQRCSLRSVDPSALTGLTNLVELDLSHNSLTSIPGQAFEQVPELRELKLNGNPLIRLTDLTLVAASKLVRLELANCQLNIIEPKAFQGLELLEWLRLDGNLIEWLPSATLGSLRSLRGVDLHHNPWNCTCLLRPLRSWLAARNMPFSVPPICLSPVRLRGQSWNRMALEELACRPEIRIQEPLVQVMVGQPVTLSCQILGSPEASVIWYFADKVVVNSTVAEDSSSGQLTTSSTIDRQLYLVQETSDNKSDKSSQLTLTTAREQDSGSYLCQVTNRADKATGNITLVVRSNPAIGDGMGRGVIAGILLAVFALLIAFLLVCCLCSLKRARLHSALRNRRPSGVLLPGNNSNGGLMSSASTKLAEQLDPLFQRAALSNDNHRHSNGRVPSTVATTEQDSKRSSGELDDITKTDKRIQERPFSIPQLSSQQQQQQQQQKCDNTRVKNTSEQSTLDGHHRPIAMYSNNKVTFNPGRNDMDDEISIKQADSTFIANKCHFPDLVEASNAADLDTSPIQDGTESRVSGTVSRAASFATSRQQRNLPTRTRRPPVRTESMNFERMGRRRRQDWDFNPDEDDDEALMMQHFDEQQSTPLWTDELEVEEIDRPAEVSEELGELMLRRRSLDADVRFHRHQRSLYCGGEFDDDDDSFRQRYAYHTSQLNRFLLEYRTLQRRLAHMQDTWSQCLEADPSSSRRYAPPPHQRLPLRPILKNRSSNTLPRHHRASSMTMRWADEEETASRPTEDDQLYEGASSSVVEHYFG